MLCVCLLWHAPTISNLGHADNLRNGGEANRLALAYRVAGNQATSCQLRTVKF